MRIGDKVGLMALSISIGLVFLVLMNDNGRLIQGAALLQFMATLMFLYAGVRGSRSGLPAPVGVVLFWIGAAHIEGLWN
jgi:hypothetical protein